jgi:hypothetical protein
MQYQDNQAAGCSTRASISKPLRSDDMLIALARQLLFRKTGFPKMQYAMGETGQI